MSIIVKGVHNIEGVTVKENVQSDAIISIFLSTPPQIMVSSRIITEENENAVAVRSCIKRFY